MKKLKQPKLTPKANRERRTNKAQSQQKEENNKDQAEINEIEILKIEKINGTKSCFFEKINKIDKPLTRVIKKQEASQINNLTLHLKQLEKEEQINPKLAEGKKS